MVDSPVFRKADKMAPKYKNLDLVAMPTVVLEPFAIYPWKDDRICVLQAPTDSQHFHIYNNKSKFFTPSDRNKTDLYLYLLSFGKRKKEGLLNQTNIKLKKIKESSHAIQ